MKIEFKRIETPPPPVEPEQRAVIVNGEKIGVVMDGDPERTGSKYMAKLRLDECFDPLVGSIYGFGDTQKAAVMKAIKDESDLCCKKLAVLDRWKGKSKREEILCMTMPLSLR